MVDDENYSDQSSIPNFSPGNMGGMQSQNPFMPSAITPGVHMPQNLQFAAPPSLGETEYLYEEGDTQKRSLFERMIGFGGIGFLGGLLVVGGAQGTYEGVKRMDTNAPWRIRANTLMNAYSKRGFEWGNRFGVVGLAAGLVHNGVTQVRGGTTDSLNTLAAGAIAPAIFQTSVRSAVASSAIGATLAGGYLVMTALFDGHSNPVAVVYDTVADSVKKITAEK